MNIFNSNDLNVKCVTHTLSTHLHSTSLCEKYFEPTSTPDMILCKQKTVFCAHKIVTIILTPDE